MRTAETEFRSILIIPAIAGRAIKFSIVEYGEFLRARLQRCLRHIPSVFQSVHMTDLIAVICRDRQFLNPLPGEHKLDDDLRIEMKNVRIQVKRNALERVDTVNPITRMKFTQFRAQRPVLKSSQYFIADKFIKRHTTPLRAPPLVNIRLPKTACASPATNGSTKFRQTFRRILSVSMDKGDEIEVPLDRKVETNFLIAAVSLIHRIE